MIRNQVPDLIRARYGTKPNISQIAEELGVERRTLYKWLDADYNLRSYTPDILNRWCKLLDVTVGELLEYVPDEK